MGHARTQGQQRCRSSRSLLWFWSAAGWGVGLMAMSTVTGRGPCSLAALQAQGKRLCSAKEGKGSVKGSRTQLSTHTWQFSRIRLGLLSTAQVPKEALWFLKSLLALGSCQESSACAEPSSAFPKHFAFLGRCPPEHGGQTKHVFLNG